jgi:hypothetical protein
MTDLSYLILTVYRYAKTTELVGSLNDEYAMLLKVEKFCPIKGLCNSTLYPKFDVKAVYPSADNHKYRNMNTKYLAIGLSQ